MILYLESIRESLPEQAIFFDRLEYNKLVESSFYLEYKRIKAL